MIFLNQYYEDEGLDSGSGWSKAKPHKHTKEIVASAVQDDCFLFRANEHGDLVGVDEEHSTHQSEYDDECNIFESTTFQKSKKSKLSSASYVDSQQGDYKKSGHSLVSRTEKPGIFDRKARSRDISANSDKQTLNRVLRVPTKDYVIDVPKPSQLEKGQNRDLQDCSDDFESDANQHDQVDVDLSGDSDLYTEVQNYVKGHKHAGGLRAKDQTGTVLKNIPTKMLMSCVEEDNSKSKGKGGIFNTHSYDRAATKQSLINAKAELDRLKPLSRAAIGGISEDAKLVRGRGPSNLPPARENSKEPVPQNNTHSKLSIVTNVFSVVITPKNNSKQQLTLPIDCPHCRRTITQAVPKPSVSNGRTGSKESLRTGMHSATHQLAKPRALTPKPHVTTEAARPESHKLDRSLLNKTIMRTDTSKENHATDRRKSALDQRSRERLVPQPTTIAPKSGVGLQRSVLQDRDRNRLGVEEFSKSPIMRTLNDSKDSRTFDNRSSWSRVDRPLHKSKDTLGLTPELSRPKKPTGTVAPSKTGAQVLASKKQNMKFR